MILHLLFFKKHTKTINNAPLLLFRIVLGALIMAQCLLDIKNGWMKMGFIDPTVDFAEAKWNYFVHNDFIILYEDKGNRISKYRKFVVKF